LNSQIDRLVLVKNQLLEATAEDVIRNSAFLSRVDYSVDTIRSQDKWYRYNQIYFFNLIIKISLLICFRKCIIRLNKKITAAVVNSDKTKSIQEASVKALAILEPLLYQMIIKKQTNSSAYDVLLNLEDVLGVADNKKIDSANQNLMEKPSVAFNMMKMMGWAPGSVSQSCRRQWSTFFVSHQ
jgi:hypothetical protein